MVCFYLGVGDVCVCGEGEFVIASIQEGYFMFPAQFGWFAFSFRRVVTYLRVQFHCYVAKPFSLRLSFIFDSGCQKRGELQCQINLHNLSFCFVSLLSLYAVNAVSNVYVIIEYYMFSELKCGGRKISSSFISHSCLLLASALFGLTSNVRELFPVFALRD